MKRILSIFSRDVKSSTREFLLLYIIIVPLLIAFGLRFFIPSVNAISFQFALDKKLDNAVFELFENYGKVEALEGKSAIINRVNKADDIVGITQKEDGSFVAIFEGNEKESSRYIARQIIRKLQGSEQDAVIRFSDIGIKISSVAVYGTSSAILMAIILSGMVIGLNIIEEKESGTISALSATPMRRMEFFAGKSLIGFVLPVIETFIILWILGMQDVNQGMMLMMTVACSLVAVILGFLVGVLSSNQIAGIANMKFLLLLVSASYIGAIVLPRELQPFLYWSPLYWATVGLNAVITKSATWAQIYWYALWIIGITSFIFFIFKKRIAKGLT